MQKAIFILGMHRSGTSALARVVNLLGVELGDQLMAAEEDNPKGFFEHEPIVAIHEQLLTELGMSWKDGAPLPDDWVNTPPAQKAAKAIATIIDSEFSTTPVWGLKDPRQCRLMPLWMPLLQQRNIQPHFIIAYRHPLEVAASLAKRGDMPEAPALFCWLSYTVEALLSAIDYPHSIIHYDDLLSEWQPQMERISKELKIDWPTAPNDAAHEINSFLSPNLRHHKFSEAELPEAISQCLKQLQKPSQKALEKLQYQIQQDSAAARYLLQEARLQNHSLNQTNLALETQLELTQKQAAKAKHRAQDIETQFNKLQELSKNSTKEAASREQQLQEQLEAITNSQSWKLTEPLRKLKKHL